MDTPKHKEITNTIKCTLKAIENRDFDEAYNSMKDLEFAIVAIPEDQWPKYENLAEEIKGLYKDY